MQTILLINDQPVTCPACGQRTNSVDDTTEQCPSCKIIIKIAEQ